MDFLENIKQELTKVVNRILQADLVKSADFVLPPDQSLGHLTLPCFIYAEKLSLSPAAVAEKLVAGLSAAALARLVKYAAAGPYLNLTLAIGALAKDLLPAITAGFG